MAQGQHKKKNVSKKNTSRKPSRPKKGARVIAPKKTKHVQAAKLKRGLEKAIKAKIEGDVAQAARKEAKPFRVVKPALDEDSQKLKSVDNKAKKQGQGKSK